MAHERTETSGQEAYSGEGGEWICLIIYLLSIFEMTSRKNSSNSFILQTSDVGVLVMLRRCFRRAEGIDRSHVWVNVRVDTYQRNHICFCTDKV